jgi:hypothetical protein
MEVAHDYFLCDGCQNRNFTRIHNFSIRFYGVNFSDDLIYDKLTDELFQCTQCGKTFSRGSRRNEEAALTNDPVDRCGGICLSEPLPEIILRGIPGCRGLYALFTSF